MGDGGSGGSSPKELAWLSKPGYLNLEKTNLGGFEGLQNLSKFAWQTPSSDVPEAYRADA